MFGHVLLALPFHDLVKRVDSRFSRRGGVTHLAIVEKDARFLSARTGKLKNRSRTAHAFELNNVRDVQVTEGALEFLVLLRARLKQCAHEKDEIVVRERLLQKMDCPQSSGLFAMSRKVDGRQNNRARIRVTRAQIIKKILPEIIGRIDIEDEEVGLLTNDNVLGLLEATRDVDLRLRRGFEQCTANRSRQVPVRSENKNSAVLLGGRMVRRRSCVHDSRLEKPQPSTAGLNASIEMPASDRTEKQFLASRIARRPCGSRVQTTGDDAQR